MVYKVTMSFIYLLRRTYLWILMEASERRLKPLYSVPGSVDVLGWQDHDRARWMVSVKI